MRAANLTNVRYRCTTLYLWLCRYHSFARFRVRFRNSLVFEMGRLLFVLNLALDGTQIARRSISTSAHLSLLFTAKLILWDAFEEWSWPACSGRSIVVLGLSCLMPDGDLLVLFDNEDILLRDSLIWLIIDTYSCVWGQDLRSRGVEVNLLAIHRLSKRLSLFTLFKLGVWSVRCVLLYALFRESCVDPGMRLLLGLVGTSDTVTIAFTHPFDLADRYLVVLKCFLHHSLLIVYLLPFLWKAFEAKIARLGHSLRKDNFLRLMFVWHLLRCEWLALLL